ncbi:GFA family protein [Pseudomonas sp. SDI]|uniref:GFA family protein n=1 Tax=Pseudomonas sp. SDI TaxID=2170734 RepID=UPI0021139513|nr:GFA family protein [Pseudomonas sp. SDI]
MNDVLAGSCLCGAVGFELLSLPKAVAHCHCRQCQKGHGAAFASYGSVPRSDLRLLRGLESLTGYASSPGVLRQFCAACGASLFWSRSAGEHADWVSVALSALDDAFVPGKQQHIYVESRAPWCGVGL